MSEEKELNFTTQNAFLHYGVKGMKWGIINEDQPLGRAVRGAYKALPGGVQKAGSYANRGLKAIGRGASKAGRTAKKVYKDWDASMDEAIDAEIARKQEKERANATPEQKAKREQIEKMKSVSDETRNSVQKVTSGMSEIEKYINAYIEGKESWMDNDRENQDSKKVKKMQQRFAENFMNKYGDKIQNAIYKYNSGIEELTNAGFEGFENNVMALNGGKPMDALDNLFSQVRKNKDQIAKKSKNVVYGDYRA